MERNEYGLFPRRTVETDAMCYEMKWVRTWIFDGSTCLGFFAGTRNLAQGEILRLKDQSVVVEFVVWRSGVPDPAVRISLRSTARDLSSRQTTLPRLPVDQISVDQIAEGLNKAWNLD